MKYRDANAAFSVSEELRLVPRWSMVLAAIAFVGVQYLYYYVFPHPHMHHTPVALRIYFSTSWAALVSVYMLIIGYISEDAPRRNMGKWLWILLCIVLQGGIGPIIYFLLRQPVLTRCPSCGSNIENDFHFCPQCAYRVAPNCGNCHDSVRITDLYCTHCGHNLAEDNTPARMRTYQD
jgi:hypothetical protein